MFTGLEMMACPNLAVSADVMQHIVHVESSANPYAIGVVGGRLIRQPQNLDEALATVQMLDAANYNYSLGLAQVNRANLRKYGLDSHEKAFSPCANLMAGAQILARCHGSSGGDWGKAFSCYYAGNFVGGFRDGYVRKIYQSINHSQSHGDSRHSLAALEEASPRASERLETGSPAAGPGSRGHRIAMRSVTLDTASTPGPAMGPPSAHSPERTASAPAFGSTPHSHGETSAGVLDASAEETLELPPPTNHTAFIPKVTGPNDPQVADIAASEDQDVVMSGQGGSGISRRDLRGEHGDAAFVF